MTTCTNPTKRPCIPPSVQVLRISYGRKCSLTGEPTDGWCRMQMGHHIQNAATGEQFTNNRSFQVLHILQLEQLRLLNNMYMSTVCQQSIAYLCNNKSMFCIVLRTLQKFCANLHVL